MKLKPRVKPFALPQTTWNFLGQWHPFTPYNKNDVITAPDGGVYMVLFNHSSLASFNPGANDGAGHGYYGLMLMQTSVLPPGGAEDAVLSKLGPTDFDVTWRLIGELPVGGTIGQIPRKASSADYDIVWSANTLNNLSNCQIDATPDDADFLRYDLTTNTWMNQRSAMWRVVRSSSYTPSRADIGAFVIIENGTSNVTITIPEAVVGDPEWFRDGAEINIHQEGTGTVTIVGDTGVSLLYPSQLTNVLLGQYATATIKKTADNEWRLFGLLAQL